MSSRRNKVSYLVAGVLLTSGTVLGVGIAVATPAGASPTGPPVWITDAPDFTHITSIDPSTQTVAATLGPYVEVGSGKPAISPDGSVIYLPQPLDGALMKIDTATGAVLGVATGLGIPDNVALSPDGSTAYVGRAEAGHDDVWIIDTATMTREGTSITAGNAPTAVALTPDGTAGYVSNDDANTVSVFSTSTNLVSTTFAVGTFPSGNAITPDGSKVFVANTGSNNVSVIATATNSVVDTVAVGNTPSDVAITPDGKYAYVTNVSPLDPTGTVSVISTSTDSVVATVSVGKRPNSVAITPDGTAAYVSDNDSSGNVTVIATATNTVANTIKVGGTPNGAAATPDQAPVAALSVTPGVVGAPTTFDASASSVKYGTIASYSWDFGDGSAPVTTSVPTVSHVYGHNGPFTAKVTETDGIGTSLERVYTGQTLSLNGGASAQATQTFTVADVTSTSLTSSADPSAPGQQVTYTATVTAANVTSGMPTGDVSFIDGFSTIVGCGSVALSAGQAQCEVTYGTTGSHSIVASYLGTAAFLPSSSLPLGQTVANCGSTLAGCNLMGANLTNASLVGVNLKSANLKGATLSGANLAGANLKGANLKGANLTGANLIGANLAGANLKGANFSDADLKGATTTAANFGGVIWSNTTCPDGTNSSSDGGSCAGHL